MTEKPDCPGTSADFEGAAGDKGLVAQGWKRRFLAEAARVDEALVLYRSMGLEARAEKPSPGDLGRRCASCADAACSSYFMIYTRAPWESR